ncbi:membrane bound hydrogenase, MbhF subunit [Thermococcus onnurineus NA1]|uniref:Membrane bound hydrogenase, MbhF subunit n=1 Tax=Thermococcus onnurineus (strain NA1) TaxID=523850 RepID=B6YTY6_THEON|nr:Na(+)/H(+) antiporter subunit B [Thermococcus onnurineus]ACJ17077.1 membrane bound hydrogenase, MbhF subunit [Thermococcus onnurineus NA1]
MTDDMGLIVKTMARTTIPLIGIFGAYVVSHGHLTPGGGFQGGATIAGAGILFLIAFGLKEMKKAYNKHLYSALEGIGGLVFLGAAMLGIGTAFFYNILWNNGPILNGEPGTLLSAGFLPIMNLAVGLKVFTGLVSAMAAIALYRRWKS